MITLLIADKIYIYAHTHIYALLDFNIYCAIIKWVEQFACISCIFVIFVLFLSFFHFLYKTSFMYNV